MNTNKPNLLFVDDEVRIVNALKALFRNDYNVFTATEPRAVLDIIRQNSIHVIVSDQRMPDMLGVELLRKVKEISPNTMRLLLTGYSDLDGIIGSVNEGEVFRYVNKPWNNDTIRATIRMAAEVALTLVGAGSGAASGLAGPMPDVIVLDDDREVYKVVQDVYGQSSKVHHALNVRQAMDKLETHNVGVVLSDLRVGNEDVSVFLKVLRHNYPLVVTIALTGVKDGDTIVGLINEGQIFRLLPKPPKRALLKLSMDSAMQRYSMCKAQPKILSRFQGQEVKEKEHIAPHILDRLKSLRSRFMSANR